MRCSCCNKILTTQESVRRFKLSNEFADMCNSCLATIEDDVKVVEGQHADDDEEGWDE